MSANTSLPVLLLVSITKIYGVSANITAASWLNSSAVPILCATFTVLGKLAGILCASKSVHTKASKLTPPS